MKYVFGPVHSWRLGRSLGVDPLSLNDKICNMDCVYCQLGKTRVLVHERKVYVSTEEILDEIRLVPRDSVDHITFSGRGEPTLALNLGEMIRAVKSLREENVAVITNSSLMDHNEVRSDLMAADVVLAKIDGGTQEYFDAVDKGLNLDLEKIIEGIIEFRQSFKGKLALQIMLIDENIANAQRIAEVCGRIGADEIQLDTPLRPSAIKPLNRKQIQSAKKFFEGMPVITVFDKPLEYYAPLDERATMMRHGNYRKTQGMVKT